MKEPCHKCRIEVVAELIGDADCWYYKFWCKLCSVKWMRLEKKS